MLKTDEHFRSPVSAVFNRTESAQLETAPTKRENGSFVFLTGPVWRVSLILRSTIILKSTIVYYSVRSVSSKKVIPAITRSLIPVLLTHIE